MYRDLLSAKIDIGTKVHNNISHKIKEIFSNEYNIFLIGASTDNQLSMRSKLHDILKKNNKIQVRYPEDIFIDQMYHRTYDLLSLENLLASSVDAVVMFIESPGSIAELGAFSNHTELNNKLIVYVNKIYQNEDSFINLGPIKYLINNTKSKVSWISYETALNDNQKFYHNLLDEIRKNRSDSSLILDLNNPLVSEKFILSLLYTFDSCSRKEIIEIVKNIGTIDEMNKLEVENYITVLDSALGILYHNQDIYKDGNEYYISENGIGRLRKQMSQKFIIQNLDNLRLKMINLQLRKFWG
jgi:hypothetical protein